MTSTPVRNADPPVAKRKPIPVTLRAADTREQAESASVVQPMPPPRNMIAAFIELQAVARAAGSLDELKFAIVNATRKLAGYDQAFLLEQGPDKRWRVTRASSVSKIDRNATLVRLIEGWAASPHAPGSMISAEVRRVDLAADGISESDRHGLQHGMWVPLPNRRGDVLGVLLAFKEDAWDNQHIVLTTQLASAYGHAWAALAPTRPWSWTRALHWIGKARLGLVAALLAGAGCLIPVPLTALAPAEIVAREPSIATAPIDGVVRDILVPPGATVEVGTPLVAFVDTKLRNDVEIAAKAKSVAEARYFKALQSALSTQKEMEEIAIAKGEVGVASAELAAAQALLSRTVLKADRAGLAIYSAPSDWVGKPVQIGERILEIGDPAHVEIKIELPVSDAVALKPASAVSLYLDGDPLSAIEGRVTRIGYRPMPAADQQLVYRVFAQFADGNARRIGLRGTARVSGDTVSLWYYLLRRPLSAIRQKVGI